MYKSTPDIFIIDNFYDDPMAVRNTALTCQYMPTKHDSKFQYGHAPWPGKMSVDFHTPKNLDAIVSRLFGSPLRQLLGYNSGKFRISNANDIVDNKVHMDSCAYAGVLYLNDVENIPGTIFYTHKESKRNVGDQQLNEKLILSGDNQDLSKWNINFISYIVFNRLVVYPANMFHGIGPLFGTNDQDARIVQLFFWENV